MFSCDDLSESGRTNWPNRQKAFVELSTFLHVLLRAVTRDATFSSWICFYPPTSPWLLTQDFSITPNETSRITSHESRLSIEQTTKFIFATLESCQRCFLNRGMKRLLWNLFVVSWPSEMNRYVVRHLGMYCTYVLYECVQESKIDLFEVIGEI